MEKLVSDWKSFLLNSELLSQNTVNSYITDLNLLIKFVNIFNGTECNREYFLNMKKGDLRAWILFRKNKGDSDKSISRGISAVKNLVKFSIKKKLIVTSELTDFKPLKVAKSLPRPISIDKINRVLDSVNLLKNTLWMIKRDKALLVLIYSVGLRISEALALNRTDVYGYSDFINVLGKGGKIRQVPLIETVKVVLMDYLDSCPFKSSEALFTNRFGKRLTASYIQKLIKKSRLLLNLPDTVTPHALRHSCATHIIEMGGDLRSVQELLGHSSISSTQIYSEVAKKYISDVYDKCHPLSKLRKP